MSESSGEGVFKIILLARTNACPITIRISSLGLEFVDFLKEFFGYLYVQLDWRNSVLVYLGNEKMIYFSPFFIHSQCYSFSLENNF